MTPPLVSIVVPTFNGGRFLKTCLESLVAQTYPNVEVLVHDNMSNDGTAEILKGFASRIGEIRCERDAGQTDALCRGFLRAEGEILGWLNADDLLMPDAIERVVKAFNAGRRPDVVYGHCALLDETGAFTRYFPFIQDFSAQVLWNFSTLIPQPSAFFRKEAYLRCGGLDRDLRWAMDWDLWCRMAKDDSSFHFMPDVLSGARVHPSAKTSQGGAMRLIEVFRVNRRYATRSWVPPMAVLALGSAIGHRLRPFRALPRRLFRRLLPDWQVKKTIVCGLDFEARVREEFVAMRFPVFREVQSLEISVDCESDSMVHHAEGSGAPLKPGRTMIWRPQVPGGFVRAIDVALWLDPAAFGSALRMRWGNP